MAEKRRPGRPSQGGPTKSRSIRLGDIYDRAHKLAASRGDNLPDIIERALEDYVSEFVNQEDIMDRVISLNPWQDGRGWVWEIENSEGVVRRSRTDTNYQGLYGQTRRGEEWGQSLGNMQITWPEDREAMIRRLAQPRNGNPGLDISALRA